MASPPCLSLHSLTIPAKNEACESDAPRAAKKTATCFPPSIFEILFCVLRLAKKVKSRAQYPKIKVNGSEIKKRDKARTNIALDCIAARIYVAIFKVKVTSVYFLAIPIILLYSLNTEVSDKREARKAV